MPRLLTRLRASTGLALAQLRYYPVRTVLVIVAIVLAVLALTLLASVGSGVLETGTEQLQRSQQDLWVVGGPLRFNPAVGGIENTLVNAHELANEIGDRDDVAAAAPIAYHAVYIGTDPGALDTVVGVGVPGVGGSRIQLDAGPGFEHGDTHYADGTYDGPMSYEVIVDPRVASTYDLEVGDTLYIGGTVSSAAEHEFTIVGVSSTFSQFLGTSTVTVFVSELQSITGTARTDRASMITVRLTEDADVTAVREDLEAQYPEYEIRTNQEQLESVLQGQSLIIASAGTLVVLAIIAGIALTFNTFMLHVYHQRSELAALKAGGVSSGTLMSIVTVQALVLSSIGGLIGIILTPLLVRATNLIAERVVGFSDVATTPDWVLLAGFAMAIIIGTVAALVASWRILRITPLRHLAK